MVEGLNKRLSILFDHSITVIFLQTFFVRCIQVPDPIGKLKVPTEGDFQVCVQLTHGVLVIADMLKGLLRRGSISMLF